jgi:UDP:flavonoid glycosyltransferase YjiC (YdhE family)
MSGHQQASDKTRILFVAEAVTLAHVARPITLARSLDPQEYEVHFAHHPRYRELLGQVDFAEHEIHSISPRQFMQALAAGSPVYDTLTLQQYVEADLELIAAVQPDIIVGDFRLTLAVSARMTSIPYVALGNAYWSPHCRQGYTVPDLPFTRVLGPAMGQWLFSLARPVAFALHCLPMHRLRRRYGMASLGFDLRNVYTDGDYTLYADIPELYRMENLPVCHRFIGPVNWSPEFPLPDWWCVLPQGSPVVYVTLGSSGQAELLPELVTALGQLEVTALISTAGAPLPPTTPDNVFVATYLPGEKCVELASLVICNGGSPGTYQALMQGVPVIGIATNLDQYLNMAAIVKTGAGQILRAGTCEAKQLVALIRRMLADTVAGEAANALAERLAGHDSAKEFPRVVSEIKLQGTKLGGTPLVQSAAGARIR